MRALLHIDIVTIGRVLLATPVHRRIAICDMLFDRAHCADKFRKRFKRCHPKWGSGSLASACWDAPKPIEPFLSDHDYAKCLKVIFDRVLSGSR